MNNPKIMRAVERDYTFVKELGSGGFGVVYLAERSSGPERGKLFAIKISKHTMMKGNDSAEARIMERNLPKERFFPEYYDNRVSGTKSMLVLEYCEAGDFATVIYSQMHARTQLPDAFVWHVFLNLLGRAIASAHRSGVIHRDIKPGNVLLKFPNNGKQSNLKFPQIKLADWGCSAVTTDPGYSKYTPIGTVKYRSKDIPDPAYEKCDVWAVGATIHAVLFEDRTPSGGVPLRFDERCERELYDLIALCLHPQHSHRIFSRELKADLKSFATLRIKEYYDSARSGKRTEKRADRQSAHHQSTHRWRHSRRHRHKQSNLEVLCSVM